MSHVIRFDLEKRCAECNTKGAAENGLCLECSTNAMFDMPMKSAIGKAVAERARKLGLGRPKSKRQP
ncbi:MAG: hypothetical protein M0R28_21490 [Pigmentiphaga sp.]|nr:hypothetical protein [Pigmentiphaga sp.]